MEDDKKMSASSEETPNEVAEIVQQEAELPKEKEEKAEEEEVKTEEPAETQSEPEITSETEQPVEVVPEADAKSEEPNPPEDSSPEESNEVVSEKSDVKPDVDTVSDPSDEQSLPDSELHPEDEDEDHEENEYDSLDVEGASKEELLDWLKKIRKEENLRKVDHIFKEIGSHFETNFEEERKAALEEFLAVEGNEEGDFEFKGDEVDKEFNALYEEQKHKRSHFFHQLEKQKDENLIKKTQILDMIREIVDGEDQTSFNKVKKLQEEWKNVGPVPGGQNRTLWANYHALMDRFYDQRTIYFELKDLDRKKNLEAKLELCEKAEALDASKDMKGAIVQLNELHEEFKHIGPVPKEDQEPLWQRFKAASDKVYEHRREYTEQQKEEFAKNLVVKEGLAKKAEELTQFNSDRIKDWNKKTKELLALQKEWEVCGGVPREKAKAVNKAFWGNFKKFYANKSKFFKSLDAQREDNLKKKQELVAKAAELKKSSDWEKTANDFKKLQGDWKEIGPVPEKFRKSVYEEFKGHCDEFFEKRRGQNAEQNQEFIKNLEEKRAVLDQMDDLAKADKIDLDKVYDLANSFSEIGLVPRNAVGKTLDKYDTISKKILSSPNLSDADKAELRIHFDVCKLKNSPHGNQKINRKENSIKRKVVGLQNDINNWRTNMDFFAKSKNADQLKKEIEEKIAAAEEELEALKRQLDYLH